ncbi:MAG: serine hydrolase [Saprospiraceae bacterium]|nr:serine hydrolase [Saprospiraceae bacterium]
MPLSVLRAQSLLPVKGIDSVLTYLHQHHLFNGVVLLADNGTVIYKEAFGVANIATGEKLTTASAFNLASVSKQFVAMTIMILKEEGLLRFDDPVQEYLPAFPYPEITLRHLMTHTSGLPEYFDPMLRYLGSTDTVENEHVLQWLVDYKPELDFQTGEKWQYSNTGYVLLPLIVEHVSGLPFEVYFREEIARPLGLKDTYVYHLRLGQSPANRVFGFKRFEGKNVPDDLGRFDGLDGDGNIYSSVEDLLIWDQSLNTEMLVGKNTLREALTPVKLKDGSTYGYGFGWGISENGNIFSHTGGWAGFRTYIVRFLNKKQTLVLLCSDGNFRHRDLVMDILSGKTVVLPQTHLIQNVRLIDGTGIPSRSASVRLLDDRIWEVGNLQPLPGEKFTDGHGQVLAPGFIDTHSHHDWSLADQPGAVACLNQGITTIIVGQDGGGSFMDTIAASFERQPVAVNLATYTGHTTLRRRAMGGMSALFRQATSHEVEKMKTLLEEEMQKGSFGLATGLEYESAFYSSRVEVMELAKVAATHQGRYISHIRSEDTELENALDEIIQIGREAKLPVQISHIKVSIKSKWGRSRWVIEQLQRARAEGVDITADCYPYDFWQSTLRVLFPKRDYTNPESAEYAMTDLVDPNGSYLVRFAPQTEYAGKSITEIAGLRNESPAESLLWLLAEATKYEEMHPTENVEGVMGKAMSEEDVRNFLAWPHTNICSDGSIDGHPRGHGAFTRILARYVREQQLFSLETAIYKMTGLAAQHLGITDRGTIAPGQFADLVLFNPGTVQDHAVIGDNTALSTGIEQVWVNGEVVYADMKSTGLLPGKFIRRK